MSKEVWIEWQTKWRDDPWGGERGDLQTGIVANAIYQAIFGAVNRVIQAIAGGTDDFDYDALPTITDLMPYYKKRDATGKVVEDEKWDGKPLDPNTMTEAQWAEHALTISRWKEYVAVRAAAQGAPTPGTVDETAIR